MTLISVFNIYTRWQCLVRQCNLIQAKDHCFAMRIVDAQVMTFVGYLHTNRTQKESVLITH